jgi:tRNA(Phe) wybutosine-synthesizing methylase Tyw3
MDDLDFCNNEAVTWWENKKEELLNGIQQTLENKDTSVDEEVLGIMKDLIENARIRTSMSNYFEELEE